jgi:mannose-6-phosphate isomerase-like protein (cupin superfamily)
MNKKMWITLPAAFVLSMSAVSLAQAPSGDATYLTAKEIDALVKSKAPSGPAAAGKAPGASDVVMSMLPSGSVNLGVSVLQYAKGSRLINGVVNSTSHSDTPEVYYVLHGAGTILTGGTIDKTRESTESRLVGPSIFGAPKNAVAHKISTGDVIIVPPNMPHVVSDVTEDLAFLIIRVDSKKQLDLK